MLFTEISMEDLKQIYKEEGREEILEELSKLGIDPAIIAKLAASRKNIEGV